MSYDIHTRINLISSSLSKVERLLEKADKVRRTKNEMHSCVKESIEIVKSSNTELIKYHSAFDPIIAGSDDNSIFDELQKAREDIESAQILMYKGKIEEADHLLQSIKERL